MYCNQWQENIPVYAEAVYHIDEPNSQNEYRMPMIRRRKKKQTRITTKEACSFIKYI